MIGEATVAQFQNGHHGVLQVARGLRTAGRAVPRRARPRPCPGQVPDCPLALPSSELLARQHCRLHISVLAGPTQRNEADRRKTGQRRAKGQRRPCGQKRGGAAPRAGASLSPFCNHRLSLRPQSLLAANSRCRSRRRQRLRGRLGAPPGPPASSGGEGGGKRRGRGDGKETRRSGKRRGRKIYVVPSYR